MKVLSIEFLVVLIGAASLSSAEKLRGDAAKRGVYKGQVHVVPFTQTGRNLEGEVPVPPVFNTDRQAPAGEEGRSLYAGGPNVVHTANEGPIVGTVFHDVNRNSVQDADETGIAGVMVSDGKNVVMTDSNGAYELPAPSEEEADAGFSVFITKPAGYSVPVNDAMVRIGIDAWPLSRKAHTYKLNLTSLHLPLIWVNRPGSTISLFPQAKGFSHEPPRPPVSIRRYATLGTDPLSDQFSFDRNRGCPTVQDHRQW